MFGKVTYDQILYFASTSIECQAIQGSYIDKGKLILMLEDSHKIIIEGKNIDAVGHKERIREIILMAKEKGLDIETKSVIHYATARDGDNEVEYVLIKW